MSYIGNTSTTQAFTPAVDYFSGNGSTVAFTLSRPVASVAQVQVNVNNVQQNPGSAYTVSGNTITFTGAPSAGTNNIYVYYTSPITQVIAPGQNTVYPSSLSYTNALYWDTSGNVGIGTSSPAAKLDVTATMRALSSSAVAPTSGKGVETWYDSSGDFGRIASYDRTGGAYKNQYIDGLALYLNSQSNGNVGIGTSSPSAQLHVKNAGGNSISILGQYGTGTIAQMGAYANQVDIKAYNGTNDVMTFTTGASERMRIDSSGRVTTPYQPMFHIKLNNTANYSTTGTIPFTQVLVNVGSYYSTSTYLFTAPVAGTYMFSVKAFIEIAGRCSLYINVNGSPKQGVFGPTGQGDMLCASLIYTCAANDTVSVSLRQGTIFGDGSSGNYDAATFSGFLIG